MANKPLSEGATKALRLWEDGCLKSHDEFVLKLRDRQKAYRGVLDVASDAAQWTSKQHPPFINHIVETTLAGLVDNRLRFKVRPAPRLYEPHEAALVREGAKAHQALHDVQLKQDRFNEKLRPFALQDAIAGLTVAKNHWVNARHKRPVLKVVPDPRALEFGAFLPRLVESEGEYGYAGPTTEVVNVEDFFWHEAAVELQKSSVVAHRVWMTYADLKELEAQGVYENCDELKESRDQSGALELRESDGTNRTKDMIEVLEIWWKDETGIRTVCLGNRKVELKAPRANPFWHGEYPFVVCSTKPDLFQIPGVSQVEKIAHLQLAHWDLENQTRDNVRLINNAIMWFRSDIDDPDAFDFEPGARWLVEDPNQVQMWQPNPISADVALPHLARLEQQMQNLAGSQPFTSTSEARGQGADTATEASLLTNLAQRATIAMKEQLNYAYERIGQQRTCLNQQFIRTPVVVEQIGLDSELEFRTVLPQILQGDYRFCTEPMNDSLMRQERKAEANALFQMMQIAVPISAALAQQGAATPLNWDEVVRELLSAHDVQDPDRFFGSKAAVVQPQAGGAPQAPGAPAQPGVTNPGLATSDLTQNPVAAMQQMQARVGGLDSTES